MARRKQRSPKEWLAIIGEHDRSGLGVTDFCRGKSVGLSSFYHWRKRLQDRLLKPRADVDLERKAPFIDMGDIDERREAAPSAAPPWVVTLDLGEGLRLTLERR